MNNIDFSSLTREEAVLCLMNMKTSQVNMIVVNLRHGLFHLRNLYRIDYFLLSLHIEYEQLLADVGGDSFYITVSLSCQGEKKISYR